MEAEQLDIKCSHAGEVHSGSTLVRGDCQRIELKRADRTKGVPMQKGKWIFKSRGKHFHFYLSQDVLHAYAKGLPLFSIIALQTP